MPAVDRKAVRVKQQSSTVRSVGLSEAKTHLPHLLDEVAAGAEIVITKGGRPSAKLVAVETAPDTFIAEWLAYRKRRNLTTGGIAIRSMIDDGRR